MKQKVFLYAGATLLLALAVLLLPVLSGKAPPPAETGTESAEETVSAPEPSAEGGAVPFDRAFSVAVTLEGEIAEQDLRTYLIGVVAAEAPASFEPEALKAQAVAARTYTIYKMSRAYPDHHPDTPVCDDITCCKAYAPPEQLRERWGADFEANLLRIEAAVDATDGVILTYEARPILAAFHSSSAGRTAASDEVWGGAVPYLVSVESPEDAGAVPNWLSDVTVSEEQFRTTVLERFPAAQLGDDPAAWVQILSLTESGRVGEIALGGVVTTGVVVRTMFSLRSAAFTVQAGTEGVTFTTAGYGHGVGMSQYGANTLAGTGWSCEEILGLYYPGTELTRLLAG